MAHELRKARLAVARQHAGTVAQQRGATVIYDDIAVGEYLADRLIADAVLVELKIVKALVDMHRLQCVSYLKVTGRHLCLLFNVGKPRTVVNRAAHRL